MRSMPGYGTARVATFVAVSVDARVKGLVKGLVLGFGFVMDDSRFVVPSQALCQAVVANTTG
jgi:hypothetical protein